MRMTTTQLSAAVAGLRVDHERMEALWGALRVALIAWSGPDAAGEIGDDVRAQASRYEQLYGRHLLIEENLVFPASRANGLGATRRDVCGDAAASSRRLMWVRTTNPHPNPLPRAGEGVLYS